MMYLKTIIENLFMYLTVGLIAGFWLGIYLGIIWWIVTGEIETTINLGLGMMILLGMSTTILGAAIEFIRVSFEQTMGHSK